MIRATLLIAVVGSSLLATAQRPPSSATIAFEVVSVKRNRTPGRIEFLVSGSGQVFAGRHSVGRLIQLAYGLDDKNQLVGMGIKSTNSGWIWSDAYDIRAVMPQGSTKEQVPVMMQALLSNRFKLSVHTDKRELPAYALVPARQDRKLGPDLKPSEHDCAAFRATGKPLFDSDAPRDATGNLLCVGNYKLSTNGVSMTIGGAPISELAKRLNGWSDRPIVDQTGLIGNFDIRIAFLPLTLSPSIEPGTKQSPLMKQALNEQLGLQLDPITTSVNVLVIDSVDRPSPD